MSKKNQRYKSYTSFPLYQHQRNALKMLKVYIRSNSAGAALVRMPTGTGKSGIIAVISRVFDELQNILVVTPWKILKTQIVKDIKFRFWDHIHIDSGRLSKQVVTILPSTVKQRLIDTVNIETVFVGTINTIQTIFVKHFQEYKELGNRLSLVIVDEGHREPAYEWAKAIRSFGKATILFTATPYRNDHKIFNVDDNFVSAYSFQQAVEDRIIRDVKFKENVTDTTDQFVDALCDFYHTEFNRIKPSAVKEHRVIIRCENFNDINDIANLLRNKHEKVVAVHEQFRKVIPKFCYRSVRQAQDENPDALFWVHQNKLIEGIDDATFSLLAIYKPFMNARALVQQIGRVIRNINQETRQFAYVFSNPRYRHSIHWTAYKKYEEEYMNNPLKFNNRVLFDRTINYQPTSHYFEGMFRDRFNVDASNTYQQLKFPLSANIYKVSENFSIDDLIEALETEWERIDKDIRPDNPQTPDNQTWLYTYVTYNNSPVLLDHSLIEFKLGYTILHIVDDFLFYYDTQGDIPEYVFLNTKPVDPQDLERLFTGSNSRVSEIALSNTDLGRYSLRRHTMRARALGELAPGLTDYGYLCSNVQGVTVHNEVPTRRYVGFTKGRITDTSAVICDYQTYINWLNSIAEMLSNKKQKRLPIFNRYAQFKQPPPDPTPTNILLDIDDVVDSFHTSESDKDKRQPLMLDDLCYEIDNDTFKCTANETEFEVAISYDEKNKVYKIDSPELKQAYVRRHAAVGDKHDNLVSYINRTQAFRVIPKSKGYIYANKRFFQPKLPCWGKNRFDLLKVMLPISFLSTCVSEKGSQCKPYGRGWANGSLFNLIDTLGEDTQFQSFFHNVNTLVCDDLGPEIADFIAIDNENNNPRIILIHAKAFSNKYTESATRLQDVICQAKKNLGYLNHFTILKPTSINRKWSKPWKIKNIGTVKKRIRKGINDPEVVWQHIANTVRNSSATKEVWLVLGNGPSCNHLKNQCVTKPSPITVQIFFLLQSTWNAVSSVGAKLKIFCCP